MYHINVLNFGDTTPNKCSRSFIHRPPGTALPSVCAFAAAAPSRSALPTGAGRRLIDSILIQEVVSGNLVGVVFSKFVLALCGSSARVQVGRPIIGGALAPFQTVNVSSTPCRFSSHRRHFPSRKRARRRLSRSRTRSGRSFAMLCSSFGSSRRS